MAGIYLHIPFCKRRCIYCDFYSTTQGEKREAYIRTLCKELEQRQDYLQGETVETIYLGGVTHSQLEENAFKRIFATLYCQYPIAEFPEITMEDHP